MRINIKYTDGTLTIGDLDSVLVNSVSIKCSSDDARRVVSGLLDTFNNGSNLMSSTGDKSIRESEYERYLESCGYVGLGTYGNKSLYSGLLAFDGNEVIILQTVTDGRVSKQVNLSSKRDGIPCTREYISRAYDESMKW